MRLSKRMCRLPLSEKLKYEKEAHKAPVDSVVGDRLREAREAARESEVTDELQ